MAETSMTSDQLAEMICAAYENGVDAGARGADTEALRSEVERAQAECERLKAALAEAEQRANKYPDACKVRDAYKHECARLVARNSELEAQAEALRDDAALGRQVKAMPNRCELVHIGGWGCGKLSDPYNGQWTTPQQALAAAGIHAPEPATAEASEQPAPTPMTAADERTAQDIRDAIAEPQPPDARAVAFEAWQEANKCRAYECGNLPREDGTYLCQQDRIPSFVWPVPAAAEEPAEPSDAECLDWLEAKRCGYYVAESGIVSCAPSASSSAMRFREAVRAAMKREKDGTA